MASTVSTAAFVTASADELVTAYADIARKGLGVGTLQVMEFVVQARIMEALETLRACCHEHGAR